MKKRCKNRHQCTLGMILVAFGVGIMICAVFPAALLVVLLGLIALAIGLLILK